MTKLTIPDHCSFCGKHKSEVTKLIVSETSSICSSCVTLCGDLMAEDSPEEIAKPEDNRYDPAGIKEYLDQHVIGQEQAKIVLSVAIANHFKRITNPPKDLEIQKGTILTIGKTGCGKTLLAKTVAKYLQVPFVIADATSLTESGYVGNDVEYMVSSLLSQANGDVGLAERGIIFIDEIDKIARKNESANLTRDVSGEGVQQGLLKLIEGTVCSVPPGGGRKHPAGSMIEIDTKNILFIAGGAFSDLASIISRRKNSSGIGFSASVKSSETEDSISDVITEDLIQFGFIPEFLGRFTTTVTLDELVKADLIRVLTEVKNNYISQYQYLLSLDNIKLIFTDDALDQIAEDALKLKTGARGLHTLVEKCLMPIMFNTRKYRDANVIELTIDREQVLLPKVVGLP